MKPLYEKRALPKKSGGVRFIYAPGQALRERLRQALPELRRLSSERLPHAHAFVPARSAGTAARLHAGRAVTVSWDLRSWFDSVSRDQVVAALRGTGLERLAAEVDDGGALIDGAPRQGLPTSPALANLAAQPLDEALSAYVGDAGVYTRYADDLTVSVDDPALVEHLLRDVPRIVERVTGWEIHPAKTHVQYARAGRRVICGVAVGEGPEVYATRRARRRARAAAHHVARGDERCRDSARGLAEWCAQRLPLEAALSQRIGGRRPTPALIEHLDVRSRVARLRKRHVVEKFDARSYLRARRWLDQHAADQQESDRDRWAVALACVFGSTWQAWVQCVQRGWSVHDACYWLPRDVAPQDGLGAALLRWRREIPDLAGRTSELDRIAQWWSRLSADDRRMSYCDLQKQVAARAYVGASHARFAAECAAHGVSEQQYPRLETRWLRGLDRLTHETIPQIDVRVGEYRARVLDRDDPRGLWAGSHTACCQHPGGEGESCAWHGALDPRGRILVVEDQRGKVVAQSWLWRHRDDVCCDNVEALRGSHREVLPAVYEAAAAALLGRLGIRRVLVGSRSSDCDLSRWSSATPAPPPSGCWTDAREQRLIGST